MMICYSTTITGLRACCWWQSKLSRLLDCHQWPPKHDIIDKKNTHTLRMHYARNTMYCNNSFQWWLVTNVCSAVGDTDDWTASAWRETWQKIIAGTLQNKFTKTSVSQWSMTDIWQRRHPILSKNLCFLQWGSRYDTVRPGRRVLCRFSAAHALRHHETNVFHTWSTQHTT